METSDYTKDYYMPHLHEALEFQDFIMEELHKRGIVLQNTSSKKYQLKKENLLGLEIKYDKQMGTTGNIYIETAEKSHPGNTQFVPSGINREDNSWLFGIGNMHEFFIFSKKVLKRIDKNNTCKRITKDTSLGFLIPIYQAREFADKCITF